MHPGLASTNRKEYVSWKINLFIPGLFLVCKIAWFFLYIISLSISRAKFWRLMFKFRTEWFCMKKRKSLTIKTAILCFEECIQKGFLTLFKFTDTHTQITEENGFTHEPIKALVHHRFVGFSYGWSGLGYRDLKKETFDTARTRERRSFKDPGASI